MGADIFGKLHEECGVFGIYMRDDSADVVNITHHALYALQHRGQESCGIAVNDDGVITGHMDTGLLSEVFTEDILRKLPDGVDTVIGTKGVYLSGGEQQRIAIARVMLKNAPILILDEATAFADPDNEVRVQQALSALSKGKTVIMIAHRLSSITDADCIYVLQDGEIVESGTHSGLIERNGIFTKMWKDYSEAAEWKIAKEVNA